MRKKMLAPIVIGVIVGLYFMLWMSILIVLEAPRSIVVIMGLPMIVLLFLWIYVVMERIQEIRSGEEDDLSKY